MTSTLSRYSWSMDQVGFYCQFAKAKRRASRLVKGKLPPGWGYKVMSHDLHYKRELTWDIKMDYADPCKAGGPWFTVRWFPCRKGFSDASCYSIQIWANSTSRPGSNIGGEILHILADMPAVCSVVDEVLSYMIQDPLLQLHAQAERSKKQCQPDHSSA